MPYDFDLKMRPSWQILSNAFAQLSRKTPLTSTVGFHQMQFLFHELLIIVAQYMSLPEEIMIEKV